jgi:outer membrane protein TolC
MTAATVGLARAQTPTDAQVRELVRTALGQATGQAAGDRPTVDLSLDEAESRGLESNLEIGVERLNPQTFDLSLASLRATYRPTVTSTFGKSNRFQLPTNTLTGGTRVQNDTMTYNGGVTQLMPWFGGSLSATFNNSKLVTTSANSNFNPQFQTVFNINYTQPLLRGLRIDGTRQQLLVTSLNRDISEVQLRATVTSTLAGIRGTYWDLVYATQAVEVARQSLSLAEKLIEDNKARVEVGTMAPIDVVQAESEAATRRQALVQAEATLRTAELSLKRLIVSGTDDPLWRARIIPVDRPTFQPAPVDLEAAVRAALEKRTDIIQAQKTLEANDVTLRYLRDQTMPALDLVAQYGMQGIGGTQAVREDPRRADSPILQTIPGNYFDALRLLGRNDYPTWNVSLNVTYPIGQSPAEANYARSRIQLDQSRAQLKALELQVATEVTNAALTIESNRQRVEAATAARELAQRRLEAEQSKFEVGMSTNFFVVQAQRDLADAQNSELRAVLDYRKALVDFQRVQETGSRSAVGSVSTGGGSAGTGSGRTGGGGGGGGQ